MNAVSILSSFRNGREQDPQRCHTFGQRAMFSFQLFDVVHDRQGTLLAAGMATLPTDSFTRSGTTADGPLARRLTEAGHLTCD